MPEPIDPNQPPAPAAGEPAAGGQPAAAPPAAGTPDLADIISKAVAPLVDKISTLESRIQNPPAPAAPAAADTLEQEIQLRQQQLAQIRSGQLEASYEPAVQAALASAVARREANIIAERENVRYEADNNRAAFIQQYNQALQQAYEEFPELKDQTSDIYKETVKILQSDPSYSRIQNSLRAEGEARRKTDYTSLDTRINLRAVREAAGVIARRAAGAPISQRPGGAAQPAAARAGLERGGGTPIAAPDSDLDKLEQEAVNSGDPLAWQRFIKARDNRIAERRQTTV